MSPVNIAMAYPSKDEAAPQAFVNDGMVAVSNYECAAPMKRDRAREDLEKAFLVECTGTGYMPQEEGALTQEEKKGDIQTRPPPPYLLPQSAGGGGTLFKFT